MISSAPPLTGTSMVCRRCGAASAITATSTRAHYTGQYCVFDELYVDSVGPGAPCPECGRPTETVREENYFFKLSAFQDKLHRALHRTAGFHPAGNAAQ